MHPVWNFWTTLYLALALIALGLSAWRRHSGSWVGGLILLASWAMTNLVGASRAPVEVFLIYFAFDCAAIEIIAFRLFRRAWWWQAVVLVALFCQLATHLWFWSYNPPPRRYHEILNAFTWVQCIAISCAALGRPPRPREWLKPRPVYQKASTLPPWRPRTVPGQRGRCPLIVRAWA